MNDALKLLDMLIEEAACFKIAIEEFGDVVTEAQQEELDDLRLGHTTAICSLIDFVREYGNYLRLVKAADSADIQVRRGTGVDLSKLSREERRKYLFGQDVSDVSEHDFLKALRGEK